MSKHESTEFGYKCPKMKQKLELESTKAKMCDAMRIRIMKGIVSRVQVPVDCCSFAIVAREKAEADEEIEEWKEV